MKWKSILSTLLFLQLQLLLNGCFFGIGPGTASFGSKSKVYDNEALKNVSQICLVPVFVEQSTGTEVGDPDSLTTMLWREIDKRKLFSLVPLDTVQKIAKEITTWDSTQTISLAQSVSSDAFIIAIMTYSYASLGETAADLSLLLARSQTGQSIAYSRHNTYLGNSYFLPPSVETITTDAIKGAVDALEKLIIDAKKQ